MHTDEPITTVIHPRIRWVFRLLVNTLYLVVLLIAVAYGLLWWATATSSVSTHGETDLGGGDIEVPSLREEKTNDQSALTQSLVNTWADRNFEDWQQQGKVNMTRVLLGKLAVAREIEAVNRYLQSAQVRGTVGSTGPFHPGGDYDFTLAGLCLILYAFGDKPDLLFPETVNHIVNVLMTEEGGTPIIYTPRVLGLPLRDTENHILMTEGSRYLKNRWLQLHGDSSSRFDNSTNGLERFLLEYLGHMERAGFHEYNSRPYIGYTFTALLNLQSFADEPVRNAATRILDRANWEYAIGSLQLRRFPPFRRQPVRAGDTDLDGDYHTAMVKTWMSLRDSNTEQFQVRSGEHQALWVSFTSYRLPDKTARWIARKPVEYFIRMGHGDDGSPEIYSGGPGFLITAGGVAQDRFKQAVARPITLMLNDNQLGLADLLQISGSATDYRQWNNTGVYKRFAVGQTIEVPWDWSPVVESGKWVIYLQCAQLIAVYADEHMALFYLPPGDDAEEMLARIIQLNGDSENLIRQFTTVDEEVIRYNIDTKPGAWVIESISGIVQDRDHGAWPLMTGPIEDAEAHPVHALGCGPLRP